MKIEFDHINLSFENIYGNDERLRKISDLIWKLLEEKFERDAITNGSSFYADKMDKSNSINLDEIVVPPIHVDSDRSEYDIASRCASAIYQAVLVKLH